ncbi:unnamed protein product [Enterobius vermicularis]|uniref:Uncharacterized protein n=1 Tax=Enterobius vermicularis TaxID=51028 RepID=A0A0N4VN49_ENTVE|nr:unnamed protein product [Enterobius vermicularis]
MVFQQPKNFFMPRNINSANCKYLFLVVLNILSYRFV